MLLKALQYGALPNAAPADQHPQAIVLLAADYARVRRTAELYSQTGLPILVTGGRRNETSRTEADWMACALQENFSTPVKWWEEKAQTTEENAKFSAAILQQNGIHRILLVTDDRHMLRARLIFAGYGFDVTPAPVKFAANLENMEFTPTDLLPSRLGQRLTYSVLHEVAGIAWHYLSRLV
jgi:uncharacterized SAM-binding protein YcdF (DUF218 family)